MSQDIFGMIDPDPDQWRLDPEMSGGAALADLGPYPLNTSRFLLDADPETVTAQVESHLHVAGTEGRVRLEPVFFGEVEATVTTEAGTVTLAPGEGNEMREEFDYFATRILTDSPVAPDGAHGLVDMDTVGRLYEEAGLDL